MKIQTLIACGLASGLMIGCGGGDTNSSSTPPTKTAADHKAEAKTQITEANAEEELKKLEAEVSAPDPVIE